MLSLDEMCIKIIYLVVMHHNICYDIFQCSKNLYQVIYFSFVNLFHRIRNKLMFALHYYDKSKNTEIQRK